MTSETELLLNSFMLLWNVHMVRNHQDGYPYLNLSLKVSLNKYPETPIPLVTIIGQWVLRLQGCAGILELFKKNNFQCLNCTKNGYKVCKSYKTKNAGKGEEKFVKTSLS